MVAKKLTNGTRALSTLLSLSVPKLNSKTVVFLTSPHHQKPLSVLADEIFFPTLGSGSSFSHQGFVSAFRASITWHSILSEQPIPKAQIYIGSQSDFSSPLFEEFMGPFNKEKKPLLFPYEHFSAAEMVDVLYSQKFQLLRRTLVHSLRIGEMAHLEKKRALAENYLRIFSGLIASAQGVGSVSATPFSGPLALPLLLGRVLPKPAWLKESFNFLQLRPRLHVLICDCYNYDPLVARDPAFAPVTSGAANSGVGLGVSLALKKVGKKLVQATGISANRHAKRVLRAVPVLGWAAGTWWEYSQEKSYAMMLIDTCENHWRDSLLGKSNIEKDQSGNCES